MRKEDLVEPYLSRIAEDWIAFFSAAEETRNDDPGLFNPFGVVCELVRHSPLTAWDLIRFIVAEDSEQRTFDLLAAGPLEDFISVHGEEWIEWIEEAARQSHRLRSLLAGARQFQTSDAIWNRIVAARSDAEPFQSE
ncbi:MAG: hypothetical protein LC753_03315 [Acidobacteria bacterium]|nr:hypothetical protein [Acidobacteriota bacterium]